MAHTPGVWRSGKTSDSVVAGPENAPLDHINYYGGLVIAESISNPDDRSLIINAPQMRRQLEELAEVIARNLTSWDTSKDKRLGFLPEVYLSNKAWYKKLTGEEYVFHRAIKKFNIE